MTRVLVVSPEPVHARMAGMGVRALRVATTLRAAGHAVSLAAPGGVEPGMAAGVDPIDSRGGLRKAAAAAELAVVSGHAGNALLAAGFGGALVADLYDPFLVENLSYAEALGPEVFEHDRRTLFALLERGDFFLTACEEQRLFTLGLLLGRGRLFPGVLGGDPEGRRLADVAPFGVDDEPPGPRCSHPALGPGAHDVFFGGVYDWYDPDLVLTAWPSVVRKVPDARLIFCESPNPATTPQARLTAAVERSREMGLFGGSVHVVPWLPYAERGGFYRACQVAVLAHRPSLEASLSFRTRLLDFLWAGLPAIATEGGGASRLVEASGAGRVVSADPGALAGALVAFLRDDALRDEASRCALAAAGGLRWSETLAPLLRYAARPWRAPRRSPAASLSSRLRSRVRRLRRRIQT